MARSVSKSANPRAQRNRDAAAERAAEEARARAYQRAVRRRRMVGVGVLIAVVLAVAAAVTMARGEGSNKTAASSTTSPTSALGPTTSAVAYNPSPPAQLPAVAPGATVTGATPCPAADGSAARTTQFAGPPPMCIDTAKDYIAAIHTSKGDIIAPLAPRISPNSVNNFVTLARYHYYDGLPITRIVTRAWAEVADAHNPDGTVGPGYTIPGEAPPGGSVDTPLTLALIPDASGANSAGFMFGLGDGVAGMPKQATQIGLITDSRIDQSPSGDTDKTVQQLIDKLGTKSGDPAEVVTITGITITESDPK